MLVHTPRRPSGRGPGMKMALVATSSLGLLACVATPLESPTPMRIGAPQLVIPQNIKNQVDILFMVDNSNSMSAMQAELRSRFPEFFKPFQDLADQGNYADLHIGVVTSDYGAGATGASTNCSPSPGGQMGRLQALGVKAPTSCQKPVGANFIAYNFDPEKNGASNLPPGQNLLDTFTCMASVGDQGCGFEHQLESVYAALRGNLPENAGFLREAALLVVVFVTNEDDSSAPPDSLMFDKNRVPEFGFLDSFRSTRFGVMCGTPAALPAYGDSGGPLSGCVPATNPPGMEFDVSRYMQLFNAVPGQGGIKENPYDVVLVGIDAPDDPFQVILSDPATPAGLAYQQCPQINEGSNPPCVPVLQHSCRNPQVPAFFGDPAIRLNTVIRSSPNYTLSSICDGDYSTALSDAAAKIVSKLGGGCLPFHLPPQPDCTVEDLTILPSGAHATARIPACDGATFPCWRIEQKAVCAHLSPDSLGLTIDRNGTAAPPNTSARIACAAIE